MANTGKGRRPIKRGAGQRMVDGKNFRLADEVRYILGRAAEHDGRVVTIGQIILFSTETGDAWLIEPSDQLAARLARDGDPEPFHIEENETTFTIDWKGRYRIEGDAFVYMTRNRAARHDPRLSNAQTNSEGMMLKISNIFG
jgi:hypothetical protein